MRKDWMIKESDIYRAKDDEQITLLKAGLDKSYIVTGCAGSGKSVLALIMTQHIPLIPQHYYKIFFLST